MDIQCLLMAINVYQIAIKLQSIAIYGYEVRLFVGFVAFGVWLCRCASVAPRTFFSIAQGVPKGPCRGIKWMPIGCRHWAYRLP